MDGLSLCVVVAAAAWGAEPASAPTDAPLVLVAPIAPVDYPLPEHLTAAAKDRLQAERAVLANEFRANARYDPEAVRRAIAALEEGAIDTVQDNFRRFAKAVASLHEKFGEAHRLCGQGNYAEAAAVLEPFQVEKRTKIGPPPEALRMQPYSYAVAKMYYGECTGRQGNLLDAVLSYQIVAGGHPRNMTFGATAALRAARLYEETGRSHYAMPLYKSLAMNYADALIDEEVLRVRNGINRLVRLRDPYRLGLGRAAESEIRLCRREAGPATVEAQEHLFGLLNEMLAVPEEYPHWYEHVEAIMWGGSEATLREGNTADIPPSAVEVVLSGSDDWGKLRPREKQRLIQMFNQAYPQRYREMLQAYFRNLSRQESKAARAAP